MLKQLEYTVTFPTTGKTLAENITFQKGFGTITGRNGAGKSSAVEFLRWCLFGSAALRGKGEDYRDLRAKLSLTIKGEDYEIERTRTSAMLRKGDDLIAAGTTPVNNKVVQLLGFGLAVFDIACVANQGELEKLGTMRPTERKQMVDSVIGLGVIEEMSRNAAQEALVLRREAAALADNLVEPVAPTIPEGYWPAADIRPVLAKMEKAALRVAKLEAVADPGPKPTELTHRDLRERVEIQQLVLKLNAMPEVPSKTQEYLDQQEQMNVESEAATGWKGLPRPRLTREQIHQFLEDHKLIDQLVERDVIARQIAILERGTTTCPSCRYQWTEDDMRLKRLREKLATFPEVTKPADPPTSERGLNAMLVEWDEFNAQPPKPTVVEPEMTRIAIAKERAKWDAMPERRRLEAQITAMGYQEEWNSVNWAVIQARLEQWETQQLAWTKAQKELAKVRPEAQGIEQMRGLLREAEIYESLKLRHDKDHAHYTEVKAKVDELLAQADDWTKVRASLVTLRGKVKQYLLPSLNRVASHYLDQMTGGERKLIQIDDEFEVLVDGQALNTLSGSEKAVANLAMRLGLGQVLTNNVMSLFIGDEIDASMDQERSEFTSRTLWILKDSICQILLVTHKFPEADYYINVGNSNGLHQSHSG